MVAHRLVCDQKTGWWRGATSRRRLGDESWRATAFRFKNHPISFGGRVRNMETYWREAQSAQKLPASQKFRHSRVGRRGSPGRWLYNSQDATFLAVGSQHRALSGQHFFVKNACFVNENLTILDAPNILGCAYCSRPHAKKCKSIRARGQVAEAVCSTQRCNFYRSWYETDARRPTAAAPPLSRPNPPKKMFTIRRRAGSSGGRGSRGRARLPGLGRTVASAEEEKASPVIRRAEPQSLPDVSTHSVGPTGARAAAREAKAEQLRLQLRDKEENRVSTYTTRLQDAVAQVVAGGTQVKAFSDYSIDDDIKRTTLQEYVCPVSFSRFCSLRLTTRCAQSRP